MIKMIIIVLCLFSIANADGQSIQRLDNSSITEKELTSEIERLLGTAHVTGMVVAVFHAGKRVYTRAFGYSNADTKQKLKTTTEFYGA